MNMIQILNNNAKEKIEKNVWRKDYVWNPVKCAWKNGKYSGSINDNSGISDEIIEATKRITNTVPKKCIPTNVNV